MSPNDLGKVLVEDCQKIKLSEYLTRARSKLLETLLSAEVSTLNTSIRLTTTKTGFGGVRYWFACPKCEKRAGVLFAHSLSHEVGCRSCLSLEYRSRRYKGMVESAVN